MVGGIVNIKQKAAHIFGAQEVFCACAIGVCSKKGKKKGIYFFLFGHFYSFKLVFLLGREICSKKDITKYKSINIHKKR